MLEYMKKIKCGILLFLITSIIPSCTTDLGWRTATQIDAPWNSPGSRAIQMEHGHKYFMPDNPRWDAYWTTNHNKKLKVYDLVSSLENYFLSSGLLSKWNTTGSFIGETQQRIAPWRICFVAIDPCIVLFTPYPDDQEGQFEIHQVIANSRKTWLYSTCLVNPLEFGTWVPYSQNLLVLNLDSKELLPIHVNPNSNETVITITKISLALKRQDDRWQIDRIK